MVRIEIRQRDEADDLARMHVDHEAGGGLGVEGRDSILELLAQHVLHTEIERDGDGFVTLGILGMRHGQLRIVVDELLDSRQALAVDIDQADDVARGRAHRIDAAIFVDEGETWQAELVNLLLLLRRQLPLDAHEPAPGLELGAEVCSVHIGQHAMHLLGQFVLVDDLGGIGVERCTLDVSRKQPAAPVENVGAVHGRGNVVQAAGARLDAGEAEAYEAAPDQDEGESEGKTGQPETIAATREIGTLGARCGGI